MPYKISDLTQKDTTASKVPSSHHGLGALCAPSGYAMVVCCPITTIYFSAEALVKKIKKKREDKAKAQNNSAAGSARSGEPALEKDMGVPVRKEEKAKTERLAPAQKHDVDVSREPGEKKVSDVPALDSKLERHPENPRVCDASCSGYGTPDCPVHQRREPERPASPGLLAV